MDTGPVMFNPLIGRPAEDLYRNGQLLTQTEGNHGRARETGGYGKGGAFKSGHGMEIAP